MNNYPMPNISATLTILLVLLSYNRAICYIELYAPSVKPLNLLWKWNWIGPLVFSHS